jgi:hypothetical protein
MSADWLVVLWGPSKTIAGVSLGRLIAAAKNCFRVGVIQLIPIAVNSRHTSARAADRAAAKLAARLKGHGWVLIEGAAQDEERRQAEGARDES